MARNFKEAIAHRRSYYSIRNSSPVSDCEIEEIMKTALKNVPSAFNSQSTRIVLLLAKNHTKLWDITKETLQKIVPAEAFPATEAKINHSFASGYGTVLFFEDKDVTENLQKNFPLYSQNFPVWAQQTSAMHQFAVWTMLEDAGFGASLQHYNPLIDEEVIKTWKLNPRWELIAQMPFGVPVEEPQGKKYQPLEDRLIVY
ncbi:nitroreductase family protein [Viscerimonas tarda]